MQACKTFKHKSTESHHLSGLWLSYSSLSGTKAKDEYQKLFLQTVAEKDGYVQFFVANETTKPVYFDDVSGLVRRPRVIQQAHYYPFGLPMAKITTLGNPEYAYFFTGKELYEDEALEWYDYGARMYDVQIGRWTTTDPEWQFDSPYSFCGDDPINLIDPDGRKGENWYGFKGSDFDHWLAKNERTITNAAFTVVGIGLSFTGVGVVGSIAIAAALGGLQAVANGGDANQIITGVLLGVAAGVVGYGSSSFLSGAFLDLGVHAGMALQGAASGAISGAVMGGLAAALDADSRGENGWNALGKGMLIGAGTGAAMGAAMGFGMSFRGSAKGNWDSKRLIHNATRAANRASSDVVEMGDISDFNEFSQDKPELKALMKAYDKKTTITVGETPEEVGSVVLGRNKPTSLTTNEITVKSTCSKYSERAYYKAVVHEYVHSYQNYFFDAGNWPLYRQERHIWWNFYPLRTNTRL